MDRLSEYHTTLLSIACLPVGGVDVVGHHGLEYLECLRHLVRLGRGDSGHGHPGAGLVGGPQPEHAARVIEELELAAGIAESHGVSRLIRLPPRGLGVRSQNHSQQLDQSEVRRVVT